MKLKLIRLSQLADATLGVLLFDEIARLVTLELPYRDNNKDISCIPVGSYKCKTVNSPKFGKTWEVLNVPGRDNILFHRGNTAKDTHGCILIGQKYGTEAGDTTIIHSTLGMEVLMRYLLPEQEIDLTIMEIV